ncbi:AEC family transporter [Phytoactinopolyspora halotolerans]|uniref:AEC family transporter n=1 Tax=Phytoactinopolyspora halotolerans TaxID=1981512 RepID=A0A6L9S0B0_9ACTN|nr:AEC family transporter [Phytoactinopolyspora halotolerans]NED98645.1 AEC family transporter [Phytoactinopolyspora halotolerans]
MQGVFEGFGVIAVVIALGYALGRGGIVDREAQVVLSRVVFAVGIPTLLFVTLSAADVGTVFSAAMVAIGGAVFVAALGYAVIARWLWHRPVGTVTIGTLSSSYVNAGNLGIPIAVYVLGDGSYVAPVMLLQLVVMAPAAFAVLDTVRAGQRPPWRSVLLRPVANPVTLASLLGVAVASTGVEVPNVVQRPAELVAGMAVPIALIVYGASLRGAPLPGAGGSARDVVLIASLKLLVQPVAAYLIGRFVLDLDDAWLLAVTVTAALPTAQNIFVYAVRYQTGIALARDAIFVTTMLSGASILVIAALLA